LSEKEIKPIKQCFYTKKYDKMPKSLTGKTSPSRWMKLLISVEEVLVMIISSTYIRMKIEKVV
jgi:hypothetical protein